MNLLGLDTSTAASAVAVVRHDGAEFAHDPDPAELGGRPAHSQELMPAVARVLGEAGLGWADLDAVAVGVGPGAFTGLRIGVATAHALAAARDLELRPVSSLAALAAGIDAPWRLALIDAGRGELFAALYERDAERWAPFATTPGALGASLEREGLAPVAAGNGSVRFRDALEAGGVHVAPPGDRAHVVSARAVCRLAQGTPPAPREAVLPQYLRDPDAKPQ